MNLSQIKLIATDMDGTLLNSNHEVSDKFFELFEALKAEGVIFVAASGRPYYSIIDKLNTIKDDIIVVAENGGLVMAEGSIILSHPLTQKDLKIIDALVSKFKHIHPIFCAQHQAYFKNTSSEFISLLSEYYPNHEVITSTDDIDETIFKVALYHHEDSKKHILPLFEHLETEFKVKVSGKHWLDLSHNLANKGHAIEQLQNKFNISHAETVAFGDYDNDIEMLQQSGVSFAMDNANSKIKSIATHHTLDNDNYGVESILQKIIDSKK